jgi:hypothetical protein
MRSTRGGGECLLEKFSFGNIPCEKYLDELKNNRYICYIILSFNK